MFSLAVELQPYGSKNLDGQILVGEISGFFNRRLYSPTVSIQIFTTVGLYFYSYVFI
jgi:hypothetical protein